VCISGVVARTVLFLPIILEGLLKKKRTRCRRKKPVSGNDNSMLLVDSRKFPWIQNEKIQTIAPLLSRHMHVKLSSLIQYSDAIQIPIFLANSELYSQMLLAIRIICLFWVVDFDLLVLRLALACAV